MERNTLDARAPSLRGAGALPLAVIVPTRGRSALLRARSLPSLAAQTVRPDSVILADDSDQGDLRANAEALCSARLRTERVEHLRNTRARGAGGAWNTGLDRAAVLHGECWVALLDDDDAWEPSHLEACLRASANADAVVSGIRLCRDGTLAPWRPPAPFDRRDFLRGNPGWQGSNTFVRLSRLEEAGRFDELLESTHDRDLAVRLLTIPDFRLAYTGLCTVTYFIESEREALSSRGSPRKRAGLARFWQKHRSYMSTADATAFLERARELFGFDRTDLGIEP